MRILAIDTTSHFGSLAIWEDGVVVSEVLIHAPQGFGGILFERTSRLLEQNSWEVKSVDCFAAAAGPGSFTGVRLGLTAVKGLGEALGKPVIGVSNLRALAALGSSPLRATVLDARRGEVYGALYDAALTAIIDDCVGPFAQWLDSLPHSKIEFISTDFAPFQTSVESTWFNGSLLTQKRELAGAVAAIAAAEVTKRAYAPEDVDANYIRRSDAELLF